MLKKFKYLTSLLSVAVWLCHSYILSSFRKLEGLRKNNCSLTSWLLLQEAMREVYFSLSLSQQWPRVCHGVAQPGMCLVCPHLFVCALQVFFHSFNIHVCVFICVQYWQHPSQIQHKRDNNVKLFWLNMILIHSVCSRHQNMPPVVSHMSMHAQTHRSFHVAGVSELLLAPGVDSACNT